MDNGAIVLATGRGGLALWLNARGDGEEWSLVNVGEQHNKLILLNHKVDGENLQYTRDFAELMNVTRETTAYSTLLKLGADHGCFCYDRLSWNNKSSWYGPTGNRTANDHVFCMKFRKQ